MCNVKGRLTLRRRIIFYFCAYFSLLMLAYSGALRIAIMGAQDVSFNRQISDETDKIVQHVETHGSLPAALPLHMTAYRRFEDIAPELREHVRREEPSVYEINADELNYHASAAKLPSNGQMLYVLYDVGAFEFSEGFERAVDVALLGVALAILLVGWLLAHSVSNRVLRPVSKLADSVRSLSLEGDNPSLPSYDAPDEIGTLAETIDSLLHRIAAFMRREREFTSHASHELRTPATVIRGAVEVLRTREGPQAHRDQEPLARIERAVADIEALTDTFLLLARHDKPVPPDEECDLRQIIDDLVDAHRHLLEGKAVKVEIRTDEADPIRASSSVVSIAVGNLVRNAFQYTIEGRVEISAQGDRVCVTDTGPGLESPPGGSGLGLTIVERLCERMNWEFTISDCPSGGARAELLFRSQGAG